MSEDILARLLAADSDEEREWLVLSLSLDNLPPTIRAAAWAAAIPHWFDQAFLNALLGDTPLSTADFQTLCDLSFVEPLPGRGYNVHERTRSLLLTRLWRDDPEQYQQLSRYAAIYCATQDQEDTAWRVEWIYHLQIVNPDEGAQQLQYNGWTWQNSPNFAYDKVELMARLAREHVDAGRMAIRNQGWALFWEAHLDKLYSRNHAAREKLYKIEINPDIDPWLSANCIKALGDVHLRLDEYELARGQYQAALPLYREIGDRLGEANCIQALGDLYGAQKVVDLAVQTLQEAAERFRLLGLKSNEAGCFNSIGNLYGQEKQYQAAIDAYQRAIQLFPLAMWYRNQVDAYIELEQYETAQQVLAVAEQMQPGHPFAFLHRGRIALWQKQPQEAEAQFRQAVALRPQLNSFHFWLAMAFLVQKKFDDAVPAFEQGLHVTYAAKDIEEAIEELDKLAQRYALLPQLDAVYQLLRNRL
ncbi:MAG: tetratricopeptide repeat protein [Anaerolineales bacterium]|nr:tetratricopeptide repeat protein [Anaerolineales bacterium]